jgi:prepilin-type N-terminal cleavage/methylation domain-containing protein
MKPRRGTKKDNFNKEQGGLPPWESVPHNAKGFTLIEVVVSITIFAMVMVSVFYFFSNSMNNQEKLKEKYTILRISREFIDTFIEGWNRADGLKGSQEKENFILAWDMTPVEEPKDLLFSSGRAPVVQLNLVRLRVVKIETEETVLDLDFLVNTISDKAR